MRFLRSLWRFFLLAMILVIMGYLLWHTSKIYNQTLEKQQAQQQDITNLLLSQATILAAPLLAEENLQAAEEDANPLYDLAKSIAKEPFVASVRFYNNEGIKLVDSDINPFDDSGENDSNENNSGEDDSSNEPTENKDQPITDKTTDNTSNTTNTAEFIAQNEPTISPLMTDTAQITPLIRPIWYQGENLGFVHIDYVAKHTNFWTPRFYLNDIYQVYLALALSFICGILFSHVFLSRRLKKKSPLLERSALISKK